MICKLLHKFIKNEIKNQEEYIILIGYFKTIVRKTAEKYKINSIYWEDSIDDIIGDILIKIYKTSGIWKTIIHQKHCKYYLYTTIRNFLLDKIREKEKSINERQFLSFVDKEGNKISEENSLEDKNYSVEIREAIIDLIEDFRNKISEEEIKYFCYFLTPNGKKLYKCLWGEKSNDAIYQDAKRKKNKVVLSLLKEWASLGVDREAVELFIKVYLSEICEKLRSLYCKEV